jgi:RecA-family ATPase
VPITPEDDETDTIMPRLQRMGAVMDKIESLSLITENELGGSSYKRTFNIRTDITLLEKDIDAMQARLVVIDPVMAVVGNADTNRDNEVRALFTQLGELLIRKKVACLLVRHLNKNSSEKVVAR